MTKNRIALLELFLKEESPLSVEAIQKKLKQKRLTTDASTIYRELEFLVREKVVEELRFKENKRLFESGFKGHHHHLFCLKCEKIEEMEMDDDLEYLEQKIKRKNKFKVESHTLEFFGICARCSL